MGIIKVHTEADFDKYIKSGKTTIVDFFAEWCGPCKMISPYFEELSNKYDTIQFVKIDVDELNDVSGKCGVRAMPTYVKHLFTLFFKKHSLIMIFL